jgi:hypothetical protein
MKDLILNFSWDRVFSLPPTEFLALLLLAVIALSVALAILVVIAGIFER